MSCKLQFAKLRLRLPILAGSWSLSLLATGLATAAPAAPVGYVEPTLADLATDIGLPGFHWDQSRASVIRMAPDAVKGPPCGWGPADRKPELVIPTWRSGSLSGSVCFGFYKDHLRTITLNGWVNSRKEEELISGELLKIYGQTRYMDPYDGYRTLEWLYKKVFIQYTSTQVENGIRYSLDFSDASTLRFVGQEEFGEIIEHMDDKK
jgi:hypothetical protein